MTSWRVTAYRAVRPLLFLVGPELVHHLTLSALATPPGRWLAPLASGAGTPGADAVDLLGLRFRNRVGLGAGFDKDGLAIRGWAALGFGFVELGTVTPRPQAGNPRPRLFRLSGDEALVNRMGFNNAGAEVLARRIATARPHLPPGFVIGVNIGRNHDGTVDDYAVAASAVAGVADYLAVNVSSPNTPGLRDLQDAATLLQLLEMVAEAAPDRPILVKLAPDLSSAERSRLLATLADSPASGVILSNTTTARTLIRSAPGWEAGGLSGRPLFGRMLGALRAARPEHGVVVASGGIGSASDAARARHLGADLVQLWTGMIYAGPGLIGEAVRATSAAAERC